MNITLKNLYQVSINKYFNHLITNKNINDKIKKQIEFKNNLFFICKLNGLGLRFPDDNKLKLKDFSIRDKVKFILNSNKQLFDKTIQKILFNNEPIINNYDLLYFKIIIFSLLFNLSKCDYCYVIDDELYVLIEN